MKKNKETSQSQKLLNIHFVKLRFKRKKNGELFKKVHVSIHRSEEGPIREKYLEIPEDINIDTNELNWREREGEHICVYYHRSNGESYNYTDDGGVIIYGSLFHKLEALVKEACLRKKHTK